MHERKRIDYLKNLTDNASVGIKEYLMAVQNYGHSGVNEIMMRYAKEMTDIGISAITITKKDKAKN